MDAQPVTNPYESPCCKAKLVYAITRDAYVCRACQKEYDVLSVEHDHVMFNGGPPQEINREEGTK